LAADDTLEALANNRLVFMHEGTALDESVAFTDGAARDDALARTRTALASLREAEIRGTGA
jgi:hypothetical protein